MPHRRLRLEPPVRVPREALGDKVDKELVVAFEGLGEGLRGRPAAFALGIDKWSRRATGICKKRSAVDHNEIPRGDAPKNSLRRLDRLMISLSGTPKTSMIHASCSCSFSPGKMGTPVKSSARMHLSRCQHVTCRFGPSSAHPRLHMSIAMA